MREVLDKAERRLAAARRVVLYGAGCAGLAVLNEYSLPVAYFVDDTPGMAGRRLPNGLEVFDAEKLKSEKPGDVFIVIAAWSPKAILAISERLMRLGFTAGEDFVDCSVLHYQSMGRKLQHELRSSPDRDLFGAVRLWSLYSTASTLSAPAGTWLFIELLRRLGHGGKGAVAECGVYEGGNAFISLMLSPELASRQYHLLDSFEGFPTFTDRDPSTRQGHFRDVSFASVTARFANFPHVHVHKGYFRDVFPTLPDSTYSLAYVDCDLYESTLECLDYFVPRLADGGYLLLHDYALPDRSDTDALCLDIYRGVHTACTEFFSGRPGYTVLGFPETTHGLVYKTS